MSDENPQDIGEFATEIFNDLFAELESRLTQSLGTYPEADRIAIITAISKAGWRGITRGVAMTVYAVNRQADAEQAENEDADVVRLDADLARVDPEPDMWAQRYEGLKGT